MDRKKAIGLASSVSVAAAGAVLAVGANFGLFGLTASAEAPPLPVSQVTDASSSEPAGTEAPEQQVIEETRIIDVPVHVPSSASAPRPAAGADAESPQGEIGSVDDDDATTATGSTGDDSLQSDDAYDDEHEADEHAEDSERDGVQPCEVHDDGEVECHDEDD